MHFRACFEEPKKNTQRRCAGEVTFHTTKKKTRGKERTCISLPLLCKHLASICLVAVRGVNIFSPFQRLLQPAPKCEKNMLSHLKACLAKQEDTSEKPCLFFLIRFERDAFFLTFAGKSLVIYTHHVFYDKLSNVLNSPPLIPD